MLQWEVSVKVKLVFVESALHVLAVIPNARRFVTAAIAEIGCISSH
jgi:hypothetical protein